MVIRTLGHSELGPFNLKLIELTRPTILDDWKIGQSSDGATLFWYQNVWGAFVNAKKIWYDSEGLHRIKCDPMRTPRFLYSSSQGFQTCLYGEHQLPIGYVNHLGLGFGEKAPVLLVEAEKTAVLMSHYAPDYIWLATGGANGLTRSKARVLRNRKVFILFDCDAAGVKGAERCLLTLLAAGIDAAILDQFELLGTANDLPPVSLDHGFDIADSVIARLRHSDCSKPQERGEGRLDV